MIIAKIIMKIMKFSFLIFFTQASENAELVGVRDGCFERPAFGRSLETYGRSLLGRLNNEDIDDDYIYVAS